MTKVSESLLNYSFINPNWVSGVCKSLYYAPPVGELGSVGTSHAPPGVEISMADNGGEGYKSALLRVYFVTH